MNDNEDVRRKLRDDFLWMEKNRDKVAWAYECAYQMYSITPGMTRRDLLEVFRQDGGTSGPESGIFVHRHCHCFKVAVTFRRSAENEAEARPPFAPTDVIETISRPYIEYWVGGG